MTQDAASVTRYEVDLSFDLLLNLFATPGERDGRHPAGNVNTVGEVPDGPWFVNRAGAIALAPEDVARGPAETNGPAPGRWTVIAAKSDGITPGFTLRDGRGDTWFVKFDPPGWRGMATGAEAVSSRLLWALGYHVPEYHVVSLRPENLDIAPDAKVNAPGSRRRPMRHDDIARLLHAADREPDGSYRISASRAVPGTPLGGFRFFGTRPDDPNDIWPHEHRRELRGYGTFAAWLDHVDAKSQNTLDVLIRENGRAYVRHYLIDFGSTLGSAAVMPREAWEGHEYLVDLPRLWRGIVGFGFPVPEWHTAKVVEAPALGRLAANHDGWNPDSWKPRIPNPAFLRALPEDRFWAARKLAALTEAHVRAAVAAGRYDDPAVEAELTRALLERRAAILRRYLPAVNPVVEPALDAGGRLSFVNAAAAADVAPEPPAWHASFARFDNATGTVEPIGEAEGPSSGIQAPAALPSEIGSYVQVAIRAVNPDRVAWLAPVHAYFRRDTTGWTLVGLERTSNTSSAAEMTANGR
ncbi:MAG TPA: hypothetical protein VIL25_07125 [Vicinamibacterales bacterium]